MKPNDEQREAIEIDAPRVGIRAGAGAGKTGVLVSRYLRHAVDENVDPDRILAITFTRKAAAEMRSRIVQELLNKGRHRQAHRAQAGPISTVHAFCERLLREHPFEAGIDPRFEVLSDLAAQDLEMEAARAALASVNLLSDDAQSFVRTFGSQHKQFGSTNEPASLAIDWIRTVVSEFRTAGRSLEDLQPLGGQQGLIVKSWNDFAAQQAELVIGRKLPENWQHNPIVLKKFCEKERINVPAWLAPSKFANEEDCARLSSGLAELSAYAWSHLLRELERRRSLDFLQMEVLACKIVVESPEILENVYDHVIVDEAQDLNPLQHKLIEAIPAKTLALVGDAQQAIYAFRGAQSRLFTQSLDRSDVKQLTINYRSTRQILETVSTVFTPLWSQFSVMRPHDETAADGDPVEVWKLPSKGQTADRIAEGVRQLIQEGASPGDITILVRSRSRVSDLANGFIERKIPFIIGDASREYFLRQEIYDVASALIAACSPIDDLANLSLLRSPLVGISLDGIATIALEAQEKSVSVSDLFDLIQLEESDASKMRSFLEWFRPFAKRAPFLQAWQALVDLHSAAQLDARFTLLPDADQLIANFRKLLDIALDRRQMNSVEFASWIENQQRMRTSQSDAAKLTHDADAVSIFTVHAAKGLEWNTVVLCDARPQASKRDKRLAISGKDGIVAVSAQANLIPLVSHIVHFNKEQVEEQESKRLLYVGMTRAQRKLCLALLERGGEWQPAIETRLAPRFRPKQNVKVRDLTIPATGAIPTPEFDPDDPFSTPSSPDQ